MINYTVIKPFTYAGKAYARGDVWHPTDHPNDARIISGRFVIEGALPESVATPAKRRQRGRLP